MMAGMDTEEKLDWHVLLSEKLPPWVLRFVKTTGRAVGRYGMFGAGDDVLLAISGGKDSLALALALSLRLRWIPHAYRLHAVMIDWTDHPVPPEARDLLASYFRDLSIDFSLLEAPQNDPSFHEGFNCYICARNRRRILFEYAASHGWRIIAMGHHLDDLVETTLMNLCLRGDFRTMAPVQDFFDGKIAVVRPLIEVHESATRRLAATYTLPVVKPVCPYDQTNIRSSLKPIVGELAHLDRDVREHILHAHRFPEKEEA